MGKVKKVVATALVGAFMFSAVGCGMIQKTEAAKGKTVVAKVNDEKITLGEVDTELAPYYKKLEQQYGPNFKEDPKAQESILKLRENMVNSMVENKVLLAKAKELNLIPKDEELNEQINKIYEDDKASIVNSGKDFDAWLKEMNLTEEKAKDNIKNQLIIQKVVENMLKDVTVSDEDIKSYYDENKEQFKQSAGAKMQHILADTEDEAKAIKAKIDSGTSFDELFKEYAKNKAEGKKPIAEDLNFVAYNQPGFDQGFLDGAKKLKDGEISDPVKSSFGYHIIKVTDVNNEEHIPTLDEVKDQIKNMIKKQKDNETIQKTIETWKKDENAKIENDKLNQ
ncbi:MAG: peptidylprolyl isomerase [Sarcina sp.]